MTDEIRQNDASGATDRQLRRRDLAARAAWLYYMAGNTQDQIAAKLNVSRQAAQRLVAAAVAEGLITFRLDHPISVCVELAELLRERFALEYVEVVPGDCDVDGLAGLGGAAARQLEIHLGAKEPGVFAFSTGRTLRAMVGQVAPMERPQHAVVSLVGTMTRDGRASPYDVVMRLADRVGALCYPLPTPVVTETAAERDLLQSQRPYRVVRALAEQAKIAFVGIGGGGAHAPLLVDGFITESELDVLLRAGAVGEIAGSAFDADGRLIRSSLGQRMTAIPLQLPLTRLTIGIAGGAAKGHAIAAALQGGLISGLITDEAAARVVLGTGAAGP
ncbi:MAG: sugar-binding domain-containing protein [Geminicoccaceae bacterium]|nr:sugar-binding domain-containing protein [Geminicoccaceae bacterium]